MSRQTTRSILLDLFENQKGGFSFGELVTYCQKVRPTIHKSTVLRNLQRLVSEGVVASYAQKGRRSIYTRGNSFGHLHAALCRSCPRFYPLSNQTLVQLEHLLSRIEGELGQSGQFSRLTHRLQFEGECAACTKRNVKTSSIN